LALSWNEIRIRAASMCAQWQEQAPKAREEADAQDFMTDFFQVFGVSRRQVAVFESRVELGGEVDLFGGRKGDRRGYIDLFWKGRFMIEMKTPGKDLEKAYSQAREYAENLPAREMPAGILISDFLRFEYYDLDKAGEKTSFPLAGLPKYVELFGYLAGYRDVDYEEASPLDIKAAELMSGLHNTLKATGYNGHDLEVYLVRLLFCLFADHTGIFEPKKLFLHYIRDRTIEDGTDLALRIERIFDTLNRDKDKRSTAIDEQLDRFPYVDGGLFEERLAPADFTSAIRRTLLECCAFDWGQIKPEIFGAMFQGVMDEAKRRALGEHYTAEHNILKIVRHLFLDGLQAELARIKRLSEGEKKHRLGLFHTKLCKLKFLDPACGCGNFLIVAYRELRRLEIETIKEMLKGAQLLDIEIMIRVNVDQFYGIEIEEFPVQVARTAMWLMDHLMNNEASAAFGRYFARLPLTAAAKIVHANAIPLDWETVVSKTELTYILGNPPFAGYSLMSARQREDVEKVFGSLEGGGVLDYVACWYKKTAEYIQDTAIEAAFVSTNSICQGEQVPVLWPELMNKHGIKINFAHQTFRWKNEARNNAAVYCVIIGFGWEERKEKVIFHYADIAGGPAEAAASHINAYLVDAPAIFIQKRSRPLCNVPAMVKGSSPTDDGNFLLTQEERDNLLTQDKSLAELIRPFTGAREYLHNIPRYCIWLKDVSPAKYSRSKIILDRLEKIREFRAESRRKATSKGADFPSLFVEIRQPDTDYIIIPRHSSENRQYIPIGFLSKEVIAGDAAAFIPNATLYTFGVITSGMHMAWMRYVCGRIKSDYRYSNSIVYNNYPWPSPTAKQKEAVEKAAQAVLDVRAGFPDASLADLYEPLSMPPALVKAHKALDKFVEKAYGKEFTNDADRVSYLFYLYQTLTEGLIAKKSRRKNL
jgi:hypothetical protein